MAPDLQTTGVQLPEEWIEKLDEIADEHDVRRSAVIRAAIDMGLRARKYDNTFELHPEQYEMMTVADMAREDRSP